MWVALLFFGGLCFGGPAQAGWRVAESAHFRIYSNAPSVRLVEQAILLEDFRTFLITMTNHEPLPDAPRLDVFMVDSMAQAAPWRRMGTDVKGFYRADPGRISAFALDKTGAGIFDISARQILLHEYAHHFMLASGEFAYPAWYVEGFAEYVSTAAFKPRQIEFGNASANRAVWLINHPWLPLDKLLARDPSNARSRDTAMFYAQSWLLTHYMFRGPAMRPRLLAYLKAFAAGEDPVEAFRTHVDPDLDGFQRKLRAYLNREATFSRFDRPPSTPAAIRVTELSPAADRLLLRLVGLEHGVNPEAAPKALADVRSIAAAMPDDPLARRALALAELAHGSPAVAGPLIDALLATSPDDPDLLRWRAAAFEPQAPEADEDARRAARLLLVRAFKVAPSDWRTLHAYARLHHPVSRPLPPDVLDVLLKAHQLAPQVDEVVLDTALALTHAGKLPEAARVLEPLAQSPHGGQAADLARRLLEGARAGDKAAVLEGVAGRRAAPPQPSR